MAANDAIERHIRQRLDAGELREAVSYAIEQYGPEILGFLIATERSEDAGTEVFAQFSEDLWRGITSFRGESSFRTWAYAVARHAAHRFHRDPYARRATPLASWLSEIEQRVRTTTLAHHKSELREAVARLREQLAPEEQALLILRVDRGMSWNEVAQVLDGLDADDPARRAAAHRKRYERVKEKLRELARREGILRRGA